MIRSAIARLRRDRRGVTIIEFAIVAPVMIALLMMLGDLLYRAYAQSLLEGAIQKAGRDSAIQGGGENAAALDARVVRGVRQIASGLTWTSTRENFNSFSVIKPEVIEDKNANGTLD